MYLSKQHSSRNYMYLFLLRVQLAQEMNFQVQQKSGTVYYYQFSRHGPTWNYQSKTMFHFLLHLKDHSPNHCSKMARQTFISIIKKVIMSQKQRFSAFFSSKSSLMTLKSYRILQKKLTSNIVGGYFWLVSVLLVFYGAFVLVRQG